MCVCLWSHNETDVQPPSATSSHWLILLLILCLQFVDQTQFYLPLDIALLLDMFKTDIQYLGKWKMLGRPIIILPIRASMLGMSVRRDASTPPSCANFVWLE